MLEQLTQQLRLRLPEARLTPTRVGNVELQLLQADFPRGPLAREVAQAVWEAPPFWAFAWPAGAWLSQWLPAMAPNGPIVDLGCGSGILSIALRLAGKDVWAVDSDPEARLATRVNAERNGVDFPVVGDLADTPPAELLVLADFLYDPANLALLPPLKERSREVLLADCRLQHAPAGFCVEAAGRHRVVPDLDWNDEFEQVFVARWKR
jgi:predicted nicotinamide N-methyase